MTKPAPFRIKPGNYRMRCGEIATVTRHTPEAGESYQWRGTSAKYGALDWMANGRYWIWGKDDWDLIARLPTKKPRPRQAGKGRWGVWVPCSCRDKARALVKQFNRDARPGGRAIARKASL